MGARKLSVPRHGSLGFLPKKRCKRRLGKVKSFQPDRITEKPYLTSYIGYKAGMTHVLREVNNPSSIFHKKEVVDAVTIIETAPMVVVGIVGYKETNEGKKSVKTIWSHHLCDEVKRKFVKNWYSSKKKPFISYKNMYETEEGKKKYQEHLEKIKNECSILRVLAHTQISKLPLTKKKVDLIEIQVNGGKTFLDKVEYGLSLFEKEVSAEEVLGNANVVDVVSITKGKGMAGVISRWGVNRLPRKTRKGLRKVACVGAWHPANIKYTVARTGQDGYFHRTEHGKKIYKIGKSILTKEGEFNATTDYDLTKKQITPMGGFFKYGIVKQDYIMIKGSVAGTKKRAITLKLPYNKPKKNLLNEVIDLKFIDTASKMGHGKFQTSQEKKNFFGILKKDFRLDEQKVINE